MTELIGVLLDIAISLGKESLQIRVVSDPLSFSQESEKDIHFPLRLGMHIRELLRMGVIQRGETLEILIGLYGPLIDDRQVLLHIELFTSSESLGTEEIHPGHLHILELISGNLKKGGECPWLLEGSR